MTNKVSHTPLYQPVRDVGVASATVSAVMAVAFAILLSNGKAQLAAVPGSFMGVTALLTLTALGVAARQKRREQANKGDATSPATLPTAEHSVKENSGATAAALPTLEAQRTHQATWDIWYDMSLCPLCDKLQKLFAKFAQDDPRISEAVDAIKAEFLRFFGPTARSHERQYQQLLNDVYASIETIMIGQLLILVRQTPQQIKNEIDKMNFLRRTAFSKLIQNDPGPTTENFAKKIFGGMIEKLFKSSPIYKGSKVANLISNLVPPLIKPGVLFIRGERQDLEAIFQSAAQSGETGLNLLTLLTQS